MKSKDSRFTFINILSLSFLILGLIFTINLIPHKTKFAPKADSPNKSYEYHTIIDSITPDGGEIFNVGQEVTISWSAPSKIVDYYNLYYIYYENGLEKSGHIGSITEGSRSFTWYVPNVLKTKDVKVVVDAVRNGIVVGKKSSSDYFTVRGL